MKTIFRILANKYVLATAVFVVMLLFFSPYDFFTMRDARKELDDLNGKIEFLNAESERMNKELNTLSTDTAAVEKYARELYHQKKDGEDVFVIK